MLRKFSFGIIIRMVPDPLLQGILKKLGVRLQVPRSRRPRDIAECAAAIEKMPKPDYDRIEAAFRAIHQLALDGGESVLVEVDGAIGPGDIATQIPEEAGPYYWSAWTWLHRQKVFLQASDLHQIDQLTAWRRRTDLPNRKPNLERAARQKLGRALSALLLQAQARGRQCTVDSLSRGEVDFVFAFADDYVTTFLAHDKSGRLNRKLHRPTFDVVFAYERRSGVLETAAKVPPKLKDKLEIAFAKVCLDFELGPYDPGPSYRLDLLLERDFKFVTDPSDDLVVTIRKVCLGFPDSQRGIDLTNDRKIDRDMRPLFACLDQSKVPLDAMRVNSARIQVDFGVRPESDACTTTFGISRKTCSLRNQPEWRVELIQKCLRESGLIVDGG